MISSFDDSFLKTIEGLFNDFIFSILLYTVNILFNILLPGLLGLGMGQWPWYCGFESILLKYCDNTAQPPSQLSTHTIREKRTQT